MRNRLLAWCALIVCTLSLQHCGPNWYETYDIEGDEPYDLYALHQLFEARPQVLTTVEDSLNELRQAENANYIFIGKYAYYNEQAVTDLLDFVERGNTAFISAYELPGELATHLYGDECYFEYSDYNNNYYNYDNSEQFDTVQLSLNGDDTGYELVHHYDYKPSYWTTYYIPETYLCDPEIDNEFIGNFEGGYQNFARLSWGKGNFYLHTNPIFFTNYFVADSLDYTYAQATLNVLNDGPVFWDEVNRVPPQVARRRQTQSNRQAGNNYSGGRNLLSGNEALRYIQEQSELALAWYLLIITGLLYVIFRGKRRQRIIPRIPRRENSSQRFIDTLSRLVYQKGNHGALARQELASLRFHLQDRFGIRWKEGEPPPENLAELIGAEEKTAKQALIEIRLVQKKNYLEVHDLMRFYRAVEPLYRL